VPRKEIERKSTYFVRIGLPHELSEGSRRLLVEKRMGGRSGSTDLSLKIAVGCWRTSKGRDMMTFRRRARGSVVMTAAVAVILLFVQTRPGSATAPLQVLRVGADPDYRPTSWTEKSGKMVGSDVDFATALASHLGVQLHYEGVAWDGIIPALLAHKIDAITAMVITDKRKDVVAFSRPYAFQTITTVVRANSPVNPGKDDLRKMKVGVMVSTSAATALESIPDVKPTTYNTVADEYNDLILGRIDVVAIESVNAGYTSKTIYPGKLRVTNKDLTGQPSYTGVALRKDDTELRQSIDNAIGLMMKDGSLARINRKWYGNVDMIPRE
jgi:ABC-type amino acid transport substrate-binding protein